MEKKDILVEEVAKGRVPQHIAIIMDGNGRWAKERGKLRTEGHIEAIPSIRKIVETCVEVGVKYLTLYAFSTENWNRPKEEVDTLMKLFVQSIDKELPELKREGVRTHFIGDLQRLPQICQEKLFSAMEDTKNNDRLVVTIALSYSSQWEIIKAIQDIVKEGIEVNSIDKECFEEHLSTRGLPNPDLLIRTGGEKRISNFLLWQISYAELYFTDTYFPEFRRNELLTAILDYQKRERRYGKTSEQVSQE
ncbi:MAG TPA: isoprenyl transferase [Porphyromonadaceae bacterium]|nr:isoprenyl transferase [Porphyromonadaceae bacterium]